MANEFAAAILQRIIQSPAEQEAIEEYVRDMRSTRLRKNDDVITKLKQDRQDEIVTAQTIFKADPDLLEAELKEINKHYKRRIDVFMQ